MLVEAFAHPGERSKGAGKRDAQCCVDHLDFQTVVSGGKWGRNCSRGWSSASSSWSPICQRRPTSSPITAI